MTSAMASGIRLPCHFLHVRRYALAALRRVTVLCATALLCSRVVGVWSLNLPFDAAR